MFSAVISPSKGKGKDGAAPTTWRTGWWDYLPLIETPRKPVQWSSSSVLLTAHPVRPIIIARHFSSSKQFGLPPPAPVVAAIASYDPPTTILTHPTGDFLFAFFPGRQVDGIGCLWRRVSVMDMWVPLKWWSFPAGTGIVAGQWLGDPRCWTQDSSGGPHRLPSRGPRIPNGDLALLLITEDHHVYLLYNRHYSDFKLIKCTLLQPTTVMEDRPLPNPPPQSESIPFRQCVSATIGLHYSDSSVFVAFRSRSSPVSHANSTAYDLSIPKLHDQDPYALPCDLNPLGDEYEINVCQVTVQLKNTTICISTTPLHTIDKVKNISQMAFFSFPPNSVSKEPRPASLLFGLSALEIENYDASPIKSFLQLYNVVPPSGAILSQWSPSASLWTLEPSVNRSFDGALSFIFPVSENMDRSERLLYAGILDPSSGARTYSRRKEIAVGMTRVLNVSDLSDNHQWESTPIWSSAHRYGLPSSAVTSPNQKQVWTASFSLWHSQTAVHALPRPHRQGRTWSEGIDFALAILSKKSIADIVHSLSHSSLSSKDILEIIQTSFRVLQESQQCPKDKFTGEMVGIVLEVYRSRAGQCKDPDEREDLTARWQAAQDMMSVAACRLAFEDCGENLKYEPHAAWPLVKLSSWIIELIKKLVKKCILLANIPSPSLRGANDDLFGSTPNSPVTKADPDPILIHLVHPFALGNLAAILTHIQRFRTYLDGTPYNDENFLLARNVLVDLIDYCPIKISEFSALLNEAKIGATKLDITAMNETLASCQPTTDVQGHLEETIKKITDSETLLDRARLFIEPTDLLDGVSRLSVSAQPKTTDVDVITKDTIKQKQAWSCLRCGGRYNRASQNSTMSQSQRWKLWEKRWALRCTCGGCWLRM